MLRTMLAGLLLCSTASLSWGHAGGTTQKPATPPVSGKPAQVAPPVLLKPTDAQLATAFSSEARALLEKTETIVLFSLDPSHTLAKSLRPENTFHSYPVLGQTTISAPQKASLVATLYDGVARQLLATFCFHPRHGLRVQQNDKTVDLLICFSCGRMFVYEENTDRRHVVVSPIPRRVFDEALTKAGIAIAP